MREKISTKVFVLSWVCQKDEPHQMIFKNFKALNLWLQDQQDKDPSFIELTKNRILKIEVISILNCFKN